SPGGPKNKSENAPSDEPPSAMRLPASCHVKSASPQPSKSSPEPPVPSSTGGSWSDDELEQAEPPSATSTESVSRRTSASRLISRHQLWLRVVSGHAGSSRTACPAGVASM